MARKKGFKHSKETKEKISEANRGRKLSKESRKKISESMKGGTRNNKRENNPMYGKRHSKKIKRKMSEAHKGISEPYMGKKNHNYGKPLSEEHKRKISRKLRLATIKYIEEVRGNVSPNIGRNEKQILDELEIELGYRIIRQFKVGGYFLDGYIPEINLVVEVDEKYHNRERQKEKDVKREEFIKQKLGCQFLRIKDYSG